MVRSPADRPQAKASMLHKRSPRNARLKKAKAWVGRLCSCSATLKGERTIQITAIQSISTSTSLGKRATSTQARAGAVSASKYLP